jgi:predicted DNA-binding ribbon-helix-helix protein
MSRRPKKHSITLRGHSTSVTLEDEFWQAFREIAEAEGRTINALAARIDDQRGLELGLASAIRLYVLQHYQSRFKAPSNEAAGGV